MAGPARYDVAVIGGGVVGAAAARDAALRGLSCVLLERGDWASGASGKAVGLVHGGLRFARARKFQAALECQKERDVLLHLAPHLVRPVPVVLPVFQGETPGLWRLRAGFALFDLLSHGRGTPHKAILNPGEALRRAPVLREGGLCGAGLFYDSQILFPFRLVLDLMLSAREHGATCRNYHEVLRIRPRNGGFELEVRDGEAGRTQTLNARTVINAAGPWVDEVGRRFRADWNPVARTFHACQVWIDADLDTAVWVDADPPLLSLPRNGQVVVGWVLSPGAGDDPRTEEVRALVRRAARYVPGLAPLEGSVILAEAGTWAMPRSATERDARWIPCARSAVGDRRAPGFVSLVGANLSLFRRLAEEGVDAVSRVLGHPVEGSADRVPLFGGGFRDPVIFRENLVECTQRMDRFPRSVIDHLVALYGRKCCDVMELGMDDPDLLETLGPGASDYRAQVAYAVRREDARHLDDVMFRRLRAGLRPDRGVELAGAVADIMARELGWEEARRREELDRFHSLVHAQMAAAREAGP